MSEEVLLPLLGVFIPLVAATLTAYFLLNRDDVHKHGRHHF